MARSKQSSTPFPTREQLLAFIKDNAGKAGTREIARAFGLKNADRAQLKQVLREFADEGKVETRRKKHHKPGTLPSVTLADIVERDRDGELVAVPTEWDEEAHGDSPRILVATLRKPKPGETAGVGDRALLRVEKLTEREGRATYTGRVIKVLDRARKRMLGIFRALPGGGGRLVPVDKKSLGRELTIPPHATMDAQDGELVAADVAKEGRFGLPTGKIKERLGSLKNERAVSLIAIHAHGIPHVFPREVLAEAEAAKPANLSVGREDWRHVPLVTIDPADAKDHDDAVYAEPDTDPKNNGGHIVYVAIADVAAYVRPGTALDREAY
ncbi:MAG: RNB domain-containing ribonuclease, partial [Pseudorhodoplanes sp.]